MTWRRPQKLSFMLPCGKAAFGAGTPCFEKYLNLSDIMKEAEATHKSNTEIIKRNIALSLQTGDFLPQLMLLD